MSKKTSFVSFGRAFFLFVRRVAEFAMGSVSSLPQSAAILYACGSLGYEEGAHFGGTVSEQKQYWATCLAERSRCRPATTHHLIPDSEPDKHRFLGLFQPFRHPFDTITRFIE